MKIECKYTSKEIPEIRILVENDVDCLYLKYFWSELTKDKKDEIEVDKYGESHFRFLTYRVGEKEFILSGIQK